ncbi:hypothetical protein Q7C36_015781 [Tachysurus vachellii]|uniref:Uncharacterized protein n=1 Tax=Tachysurus vachellii TaxID=175792 RepID=A0AA88M9Y7_TACVA|nr:hypothetical protein Q7C36_015781 [Tachysurus vachellii]
MDRRYLDTAVYSVDFLKAPGRSSDKFQPEEMDPSLAEHQSHDLSALPESSQTSFLILGFMKVCLHHCLISHVAEKAECGKQELLLALVIRDAVPLGWT